MNLKIIAQKKPLFPRRMEYLITEECTRACSICWGSHLPKHEEGITLAKQKRIIDVMLGNGVGTLTITGGEPLMVRQISELLKYARDKGMKLVLYTNGTLVNDTNGFEIFSHIDRVSLSINNYTQEKDKYSGRDGSGTFDDTLRTIEFIKRNFRNLSTQVLTVVSSRNVNDLNELGELLDKERTGLVNFRWRINRYQRIGRSAHIFSSVDDPFLINRNIFSKIAKEIQGKFGNRFPVIMDPVELDKSFVFIFPDGQIVSSRAGEYTILGGIEDYAADL